MTRRNQPHSPPPPDYPDFSRISTPGRSLSLGRLFDIFNKRNALDEMGDAAEKLIHLEHSVATDAYRNAAGSTLDVLGLVEETHPDRLHSLETARTELIDLYIDLGLAAGQHQAVELVRGIEAQAALQAPDLPPR